eukprot:4097186-Amphidinium_carterae.1
MQCANSSATIVRPMCRDSKTSQSAMHTLGMLMTMIRVRVTTMLVTQLDRISPNRLLNFDSFALSGEEDKLCKASEDDGNKTKYAGSFDST